MDEAALAAYGRSIAQVARTVEAALGGLTLSGYRILALVAEGNERSSQLAGRLALARPTISNAVDQLVERGYLSRATNPEDRRAIALTVTEEGRAAIAAAERTVAERLSPAFSRLDDPDTVLRSMEQLTAALAEVRSERIKDAAAAAKARKAPAD